MAEKSKAVKATINPQPNALAVQMLAARRDWFVLKEMQIYSEDE